MNIGAFSKPKIKSVRTIMIKNCVLSVFEKFCCELIDTLFKSMIVRKSTEKNDIEARTNANHTLNRVKSIFSSTFCRTNYMMKSLEHIKYTFVMPLVGSVFSSRNLEIRTKWLKLLYCRVN